MLLVKRLLLGLAALVVLVVFALIVTVLLRQHRTFSAPYPELRASTDPAAIARGRYLVNGPAHCVGCHGDPSHEGQENVPLSGGRVFRMPFGKLHIPNLTPDVDTGIGRRSDGEIARALRHGVGHDGHALLPFMPFAHLSDEDVIAVLSFLRAQPSVRNAVPPHDFNLLGRALRALVFEPQGPTEPVPSSVTPAATVEYGRYLASSVANCRGCHTNRDMTTGQFTGEPFAGGFKMGPHVTRNLTPDPETGWISQWTEDDFVSRFRNGRGMPGSPMPWREFSRMTDDDLRAIYRFLRSLPPVRTEPISS